MTASPDQEPPINSAALQGPCGLVLAAGAGRRLGLGPKALLRSNGRTLVESLVESSLSGPSTRTSVGMSTFGSWRLRRILL